MYNSTTFTKFMELFNHRHNSVLKCFHHPKGIPWAHLQ